MRTRISILLCQLVSYFAGCSKVSANVSGLCDGGAIEAQIFNFAQKLNRRTTVELCSFAPLLQNPCCMLCFYFSIFSSSTFSKFLSSRIKSLKPAECCPPTNTNILSSVFLICFWINEYIYRFRLNLSETK